MKVFPFVCNQVSKVKLDLALSFVIVIIGMSCIISVEYLYASMLGFIGENPTEILSNKVYKYIAWIAILYISHSLLMGAMTFFEYRTRIKMKKNILWELFKVTHKHSNDFFDKEQAGTISTKISLVEQKVNDFFFKLRWSVGVVVTKYVITFCILYKIDVFLAFMIIGLCMSAIVINVFLKKRLKELAKTSSKLRAKVIGFITDSIINNRLVKNSASILHEKLYLRKHLNVYLRANIKESKETGFMDCYNTINIMIINLLALLIIIYFWAVRDLSLTNFIIVFTLMQGLILPIHYISQDILEYIRDYGKVEEALEVIYQPHQIVDIQNAKDMKVKENSIEFKNVSFSYNDTKQILDRFNLKIEPNQKVGIVGLSGAGKSTLINLIMRAIEVDKGKVMISGQDIKKVKKSSLMAHIALISQETALFNRSILENIKTSKPKASLEEVIKASKQAYIYDTITKMPNGFDSVVGDRGVKISGGERQRICIASAILKNTPILILDEATSALDSKSEKEIEKALKNIMKNKTVIAIAHRLSTLNYMDRIIVLDNGQIVEDGTRKELLKNKKGLFKKLYDMQSK